MAADIVELMRVLGHGTFAVAGHDRGAYVALRTALDYQDRTTHLVILDAVPIGEALARATSTFAQRWWTSSPVALQRGAPFVIESLEAVT
jgi:haloacetate dehalogenase